MKIKKTYLIIFILMLLSILTSRAEYRNLNVDTHPVVMQETIKQTVVKNISKDGNEKLFGSVGKSQVIKFDKNIKRISITDPELADIVVISPKQIIINGKKTGSTTLIFWAEENNPRYKEFVAEFM